MSTNMNLLRGKLKERSMTQQELAHKIGMDSSTLSRKLASDGLKFTVGEMHDKFIFKGGESEMTFEQFKKTIPHIKKKMQGWPYKAIIIDGPQGPTGKTTAAKLLREQGLTVYEDWEVLHVTLDALLPEWQESAEKR